MEYSRGRSSARQKMPVQLQKGGGGDAKGRGVGYDDACLLSRGPHGEGRNQTCHNRTDTRTTCQWRQQPQLRPAALRPLATTTRQRRYYIEGLNEVGVGS
eukprot:1275451-Rhodomonas_salina.1